MLSKFLVLELKNSLRAVRKTITGVLIALFILTVAAAAVSFVMGRENTVKPLKAAIVLEDEGSLMKMLIRYISYTDSVRAISEFEYMDRDEAFAALNSKDADLVIDIPENFFNDVYTGLNPPLNIYMRRDGGLLAELFAEVVRSGTEYVRIGEAAAYAFLDVNASGEYTLVLSNEHPGDHIANAYADRIMRRQKLFDTSVISGYGSLHAGQFYFMTFLLVLLLYSGLGFGYLYDSEEAAVEKKLSIYGIGRFTAALVKESVMTLHLFLLSLVVSGGTLLLQRFTETELFRISVSGLLTLLMISFSVAVLLNLIYSVSKDPYAAVPLILILMVIFLLLGGMIVPADLMPSWAAMLGRLSPFTYMKGFFERFFFDGKEGTLTALLLFPVVFLLQTAGILWKRHESDS
ncbi:MAG: ABC transporter permease [Lachnospiraceae bacterium]|nr:ABC transporter permease [Lachnospiraceae bacterium]